MRVAISKKTRFEVFKRDNFTCQYCSAKPPHVPLEIDHINPVSKGGKNCIDNLITACFDCNRGKGDRFLDSIPDSLVVKLERIKLANKQFLELQKVVKQRELAIKKAITMVEDVYTSYNEDYCFSEHFKPSVAKFIEELGIDVVINSMHISASRVKNRTHMIKYFCGICWNTIKER